MSASVMTGCRPLHSVAIFRALNLGDLLCSVPAFRGLRKAFPQARITLVGLESARPVVERFHRYLDELVLFPGDPAFPEQTVRSRDVPDFYRNMKARRFDLVLQMHGSGERSNAIVQAMTEGPWAGFVPRADEQEKGRLMLWPDELPEIKRYLSLLEWLGLPAYDAELEFPLTQQDKDQADTLIQTMSLDLDRLVFVHPGARLESRRWPLERYARIADTLAQEGWQVAITGSKDEIPLANALLKQMQTPARSLCGTTSVGALASLLLRGRLLICNDTGISHIAAAVGLPSVVIASGSDVARWAPLDTGLHTVLHHPVPCRPCAYSVCPIAHPCARAIGASEVLIHASMRLEKRCNA